MNLENLNPYLRDTDIEFLSTGRRSYARRPPVVIAKVETVEKIVEKPVVQVLEKVIEKPIEVPVISYVEKPIVKKYVRKVYIRRPVEYIFVGILSFILGFLLGFIL